MLKPLSVAALFLILLPCLMYMFGSLSLDAVKWTALAGTAAWFVATPLWMGRELPVDAAEVEI